ncbi:uncharacterized protein N7518_004452 [Penicillium psychrosexuale]|uniref:uncharacterized protein n=1 Tax=Penicillium psychrosexuale TaxID=1002107 RepID=UPI0025452142|nr:uncharacterized protein N7518_004452 [Penicillium psychrosexuale]KAJ5795912.1 hypothetical protein N7518_004452 [Penicillium psychrosexuale]
MLLQALLTFATLGLAANDSVVSLFIPNAHSQSLVGEVLGAHSATTTYSINCPNGTNSSECGMGPGLFFTAAPTSVEYLISSATDLYNHVVCDVTDLPTGAYTCTDTVTGTAGTPGTSTSTVAWDQITLLAVTITSTASAVAATANSTLNGTTTGVPSPAAAAATTIATTPAASAAGRSGPGLVLAFAAVQALLAML